MKRKLRALTVIAAALVVAFHAPAVVGQTSGGTLVVGSQHSTTADFESGSLTNLTASDGSVKLLRETKTLDSFEDGDISEYSGDTSDFAATTTTATDGAYSLEYTEQDGSFSTITRSISQDDYEDLSTDMRVDTLTDAGLSGPRFMVRNPSGDLIVRLSIDRGFQTSDAGSVVITGGSGTIDTGIDVSESTFYEYSWQFDWTAQEATLVVWNLDGSKRGETTVSFANSASQIGDYQMTGVTSAVFWDDIEATGSPSDTAQYISPTHFVNGPEQAAINITQASNVSIDATVRTDGGTTLGSDTFTTAANHTISLSNTSSSQLETVLDVTVTGSNPQFELADESILFKNDAPVVDNSTAGPTGEIATATPTLSIDLSDSQFGTAQGESLTVEWIVDGSVVQTSTENANGTAEISTGELAGGSHNWSVRVTDDYGSVTTSQEFQFTIPSSLTIRNVSAPNDTISGATAEVTFYYSDQTDRRSDDNSDGVIDLTGLPVDQKFVVVVDAEGYLSRHIIIDSIFQQNSVYLLPENATTVESRFTVDDPTGEFESGDTEVLIQRSIERDFDGDGDQESEFATIAGDEAGVAGFTTMLEEGARYRIIVRNQQGDTRILGAYTATVSETVVLEPTALGVSVGNESLYNTTARQENTTSGQRIVFEYADNANMTTDLTVSIWEQGNRSNSPTGFANTTFGGPLGTARLTHPLSAEEANTNWIVYWEAERGGKTITGQHVIGPNIQDPITGNMPDWLGHAAAIAILVLVAGLFSQLNVGTGAVTTSLVGGGLWWLGFLPPGAGGAVVVALAGSVIYKVGGDE